MVSPGKTAADPAPGRKLRVMTMSDGIGVFGGAEELARRIAERLDPERFESLLCATRSEEHPEAVEVLAEVEAHGVEFIAMDRGSRYDLRPWRSLIEEMRRRRIDILHTHKVGSNFWGALIAPRVPVPVFVAHEHTWSWQGQPLRRWADRFLIARRADAFVAVSEADRRRMTEIERIPPEKTRYIPNGIMVPERPEHDGDVRAELGIRPDQPVVGMVATLRPQKAYDVLIRAAGRLRDRVPGVRVLVAGGEENQSAAERPRLQALIDELGLGETVTLLGVRRDAFNVIEACDVGTLSSDYEGSPLTVLEYMEAGKPVVATRVGGVPDQVVEGETGLLVAPRDPAALAEALASLLRDPERAREMGAAGRERRLREFTIEATTRRVEELYEELYAAKAGQRP